MIFLLSSFTFNHLVKIIIGERFVELTKNFLQNGSRDVAISLLIVPAKTCIERSMRIFRDVI